MPINLRSWSPLGDSVSILIPDSPFDVGRERVDQLVPLDHRAAERNLPAQQSLRRASKRFGHEEQTAARRGGPPEILDGAPITEEP